MPQGLTDDKSTLVQVMAWCREATSHHLNQCWLRSLAPYGVTRPQWVKPNSREISFAYKLFSKCHIVPKFCREHDTETVVLCGCKRSKRSGNWNCCYGWTRFEFKIIWEISSIAITTSGRFYSHGLTLIPAWISNHMPSKVWGEITYPFLNFNGCTVEV